VTDALTLAVEDLAVRQGGDPHVIVAPDHVVTWRNGTRQLADIDPMADTLGRLVDQVPPALWDLRFG